jgi:hypothetical protein
MDDLILFTLTYIIVAVISAFIGAKINAYRNKKKCIKCLVDMAKKLREYKEFKAFNAYDAWYGKIAR